nr:MAG TPA: hypothetical protein [Caudoviricetes sp.]
MQIKYKWEIYSFTCIFLYIIVPNHCNTYKEVITCKEVIT